MPSFGSKEGYLPTNLPDTLGQQRAAMRPEDTIRIDLLHVEPWTEATKGQVIIQLNREELPSFAHLRVRLRQARDRLLAGGGEELVKKQAILISPDMVVWHKHVVAAFDSAIDTGFKNIQFTVPK